MNNKKQQKALEEFNADLKRYPQDVGPRCIGYFSADEESCKHCHHIEPCEYFTQERINEGFENLINDLDIQGNKQ